MNKCKNCGKKTKNKKFCSMQCRDIIRKVSTRMLVKCKTCGVDMYVYKKRIRTFCSIKCVSTNADIIKKRLAAAKKTNLERYGVEYPQQSDIVKNKIKKTNLERYGNTCAMASLSGKCKIKKTNLERYGVEYPQQSAAIKAKTKKTVNAKYGGYTYQSDQLTKKVRSTMLEKYGVDNPLKSSTIKDKVKKTNLERYGAEWGLATDTIKNKSLITLSKKYGTDITNISQVPNIRKKIRNTNLKASYKTVLDRIPSTIMSLFTEAEFNGVGYYDTLFKFQCITCNSKFEQYLYSSTVPICRKCNPIPISKFEVEVYNFLKEIYSDIIIRSDRNIIKPKELDIYLPDLNLAIECNGNYWHSEISGNKDKNYHLTKTQNCDKAGIRLIHIFEDEWINKQEIVKTRLKHILGKQTKSIYARKCTVKEISTTIKNNFLDKTHIQGKDKSSVKLGLYYENELISVMTFSKRKIFKNTGWELSRFATKYNVVGGASKLLTYFKRIYVPDKIITYSDIRWNSGAVYQKLGFTQTSQTPPGYFYLDGNNRINRINFQKHKLKDKLETFDASLTEWENMQLNGYDRIWDCGNLKYKWKLT